MDAGVQQEYRKSAGIAALWYGVLAAPLALIFQMLVNYALVHRVCDQLGRHWLHVTAAAFLAIAASGAFVSWSSWQRSGREWPDSAPDVLTRVQFLAVVGMGFSMLIMLVLAAQWLAIGFIDPCMR